IGSRLVSRAGDVTLAFASNTPEHAYSIAPYILAASRWSGIGAGTSSLIVPIYKEAGSLGSVAAIPTAAAKIAIELGWPMLWGIVIVIMAGIFLLLRGALSRGRDSFYPAAGAGSLVFSLLWAFCDTGILAMPVDICSGSIVGLAFAQCKSRS